MKKYTLAKTSNTPDIVKVNWSGGKDSTCAVMKHIQKGNKVIAVCYIPMLTKEIPLLLKEHYQFILKAADRFRSLGATVHIVTGMTYYDYVHKRSSRGKFKGRAFGFPHFGTGMCGFKRDSKLKALKNLDIGIYDYEDVGIAFDEKNRQSILNERKRSILYEFEITEKMAFQFCEENKILSPHYENLKRDGCALCPHAKAAERILWLRQYPDALPVVLELQQWVQNERPDQAPLRNRKWFIENDGTIN